MRVILLAGYRETSPENCPWLARENGVPLLEQRIRDASRFGQECIVVLAGPAADEALRCCPSLERAELVFDTNPATSLLSNLRAALQTGVDPALVLPAELTFGDPGVAERLIGWAVQQGVRTTAHFYQARDPHGDLVNQGFPLVLTLGGAQEILRKTKIASLADLELTLEPVPL